MLNKQPLHAVYHSLLLVAGFISSFSLNAQITEKVFRSDPWIEPGNKGELSIEIDNISFFKNNEFEGDFLKGYTLPGFWAQAKAVYYPLENIKLEAGIHGLRYWGADRYPNYAYNDIANWKSNKYQHGMHLLPFFRAQVAFSPTVTVVLGNLYGGANHRLIEPIYNPELNLTADPEMGLQLIHSSRFVDLDVWVNWESFIFDMDFHQEAFTFGLSNRVKLNQPESRFHLYLPLQALAQHRGGEINTVYTNSVQTFMNGAIGLGMDWNIGDPVMKKVELEVDLAGYYQQAGDLWPFENGHGIYTRAAADIWDFRVQAGYWSCDKFISMFGSPFFGAVSMKQEGMTFKSPKLFRLGAEYTYTFGKGYAIGIDLDIFHHFNTDAYSPEGIVSTGSNTSFTAGIYLRLNPSFLIRRF